MRLRLAFLDGLVARLAFCSMVTVLINSPSLSNALVRFFLVYGIAAL